MEHSWRARVGVAPPSSWGRAPGSLGIAGILRRPIVLSGALWPSYWLLVGLLMSSFYLFEAILASVNLSTDLPEPLYPPVAIVLAALLLTPKRIWWLLLIESYAVQVALFSWHGEPLRTNVLGQVPNIVEPLVAALMIRRFVTGPVHFDTLRELTLFGVCVVAASTVGASLGASVVMTDAGAYWPAWQAWFLSDLLAYLLVAPMVLVWVRMGRRPVRIPSHWRVFEAALLCAALVATCALVFATHGPNLNVASARLNLPVPLLLWAAVRFGPRGITGALCLVTIFAIPAVARGFGPFVAPSTDANLLKLQVFLLSIGVPLLCLVALIRERGRALERLGQSEERNRTVVRNLPKAAVLLFGQDLRHLFADGPELDRLGLDRASAEGKTVAEAFPADIAAVMAPQYQAALAGSNVSFDLVHAGRSYHAHALPISDADRIAGMVVLQEVTEERRAEEWAAFEDARTTFFNNVSYALRTPLTLLLAPLQEVLASPPERLDATTRTALSVALQNGVRLLKLVNALLDLSRLESDHARAVYAPTDLAAYTAELASEFRAAIEQAGLQLVIDCPTLREPIYVDRKLWEQIVFSLLANALKFTFVGKILVALGMQGDRAVLSVLDTGVGIPTEEIPHVFKPFHRVPGARARTDEGTGVGLALVERMIKLNGGTVECVSVLGRGSTFTMSVPRGSGHLPAGQIDTTADRSRESLAVAFPAAVERQRAASDPGSAIIGSEHTGVPALTDPAPDASRRSTRLLVVERDPDLRAYIARLLDGRGTVKAAADAKTALEIARGWKPDLILKDLPPSGLTAFELLKALRTDPELRSVSVIVLSAWADSEMRTRVLRAGADDFLVKPFTVEDLLTLVDGQLKLARMRSETWTAAERKRLAFDLHDSATQSVYSLTLLAEAACRASARGNQGQVDEYLKQLSETAQLALREMRLLVSQLRPSPPSELGLVEALEHRLNTVERRAGLTAQLVVTGEIALPSEAESEYYLIAQEALNNTLKHASATVVVVRLTARPHSTTLRIADNGRGFDVEAAAGGVGLDSMRERAARIGASVEIGRRRRGGTHVTVRLPADGQCPFDVLAQVPDAEMREVSVWTGRSVS